MMIINIIGCLFIVFAPLVKNITNHSICVSSFIRFCAFADGGSEVEKAPFLAKPVRLTPAWEANNLPNDELNFKGTFNKHHVCLYIHIHT